MNTYYVNLSTRLNYGTPMCSISCNEDDIKENLDILFKTTNGSSRLTEIKTGTLEYTTNGQHFTVTKYKGE